MTDHDDIEPLHNSSPTDQVITELQLFGHRPFDDQPDPRPLPEGKMIGGAVADIFDALVATLSDTRLEPDLDDLLLVDSQPVPSCRRPHRAAAR
ncbi:hypothetical protein ACVWW5_008534 [Bradyrhizobium sp. LM3.4]